MRRLLPIFTVLLSAACCFGQGAETNSLSFLKLSGSARAMALSDILVAGAEGNEALKSNPASLSMMNGVEASFNYGILPTIANTDLIVASSGGEGGFGIAVSALFLRNGEIEVRQIPSTDPLSTSIPQNFALGVTVADQIADSLYVGLTAKWVNEKIVQYTADGYGFDLGAIYNIDNEFQAGLALQDVGRMSRLANERSELPSRVTASLCGRLEMLQTATITSKLIASYQQSLIDKTPHAGFGASASYKNVLGLSASYVTGFDTRALAIGANFTYGPGTIAYTFAPSKNGFDATNVFGLSVRF